MTEFLLTSSASLTLVLLLYQSSTHKRACIVMTWASSTSLTPDTRNRATVDPSVGRGADCALPWRRGTWEGPLCTCLGGLVPASGQLRQLAVAGCGSNQREAASLVGSCVFLLHQEENVIGNRQTVEQLRMCVPPRTHAAFINFSTKTSRTRTRGGGAGHEARAPNAWHSESTRG